MPLGVKPCCATCKTTNSSMWRKNKKGYIQCNSCGLKDLPPANDSATASSSTTGTVVTGRSNGKGGREATRKSSRNVKKQRYKQMVTAAPKHQSTKGKSRRIIFKRNPMKSPESVATVVTSDSVFHNGVYIQKGDIVSILDHDGGIYYAQIRGLMQDQYCEKSAVITWLLPTKATDPEHFNPATYILGPEEDLPRSLEYMEFVCHAPSEYYKSLTSPYPVIPSVEETGFVWSKIIPNKPPGTTEIFGAS